MRERTLLCLTWVRPAASLRDMGKAEGVGDVDAQRAVSRSLGESAFRRVPLSVGLMVTSCDSFVFWFSFGEMWVCVLSC